MKKLLTLLSLTLAANSYAQYPPQHPQNPPVPLGKWYETWDIERYNHNVPPGYENVDGFYPKLFHKPAITPPAGDNSNAIATTEYVDRAVGARIYGGNYRYTYTPATTFTVYIGATLPTNNYYIALGQGFYPPCNYKIQNKTTTTFDIVFEYYVTDVNFDWIIASLSFTWP